MFEMGISMRNAVEKDLYNNKDFSLIIGKHRLNDDYDNYLNKIKSQIDAVWVIAPESDDILLDIESILSDKIWIGCQRCAIKIATSKSLTKKKLSEFGILNPDLIQKNRFFTNYVLKPDDGAGSENTKIFHTLEQAINEKEKLNEGGRKYILEKFIEGNAMSFSMLCFEDYLEIISIKKQIIKISPDGKISFIKNSFINQELGKSLQPKIFNIAKKLRKAIPGLMGFVGVDFVLDKNNDVFVLEVNPRLTCSFLGLSNHLNRSLSEEILKIFIK